jgi:hypothetical protein
VAVAERYTRDDGAEVRVDDRENGEVYFVAWSARQEIGVAKRMTEALFAETIEREGMRLVSEEEPGR